MPKLEDILEDSEEEPEPDAVMEVPLKKVKLIVGPGGERIKLIERKSKARLQVGNLPEQACTAGLVYRVVQVCRVAGLHGQQQQCMAQRCSLWHNKDCLFLQILKEEEELNRAFGAGPKLPVPPKAAAAADGEEGPKMTRILLYGNANQCEVAQRMIEEAMDNKVGWRLMLLRLGWMSWWQYGTRCADIYVVVLARRRSC